MITPLAPPPPPTPRETPAVVALAPPALVAIDRDKALIFLCLAPGTQPRVVLVATAGGNLLQAQFSERSIEPGPAFFDAIAQALGDPGPIQITGCGADSIPMVNALLAWFETCHPTLAARIITTSLNSDRHCSSSRLLMQARRYLATARRPGTGDSSKEATRVPFES